MQLVVGLGNPGPRYAGNRHNVGFHVAEAIARRHGFGPWRARFQGQVAEGHLAGDKVLLLCPTTYMNHSGRAVGEAVRFYKLTAADVLVIHDDLDLIPAKVRVKTGGGHGGHNGLRDIDGHLGRDYRRLRIGVGHPGDKNLVTHYVLQDFAKAERDLFARLVDEIAAEAPLLLAEPNAFMTRIAQAVPPPRPNSETAET